MPARRGRTFARFELASGRALSRSLEDLRKHRRSIISGPLPAASLAIKAAASESEPTNEPTDYREIATNEPTDYHEIATNEPTANLEIVTNEPTDQHEIATNEPTDYHKIVTNEPTDAADGDSTSLEPGAGTTQRHQMGLKAEVEPDQTVESYEQGVARRKARRAESLRKLNEQARHEAASAMALRRAHRRELRINNGKRGGQSDGGRSAPGGETGAGKCLGEYHGTG